MVEPVLMQIKGGWLARGEGWAVRAATAEDARAAYAEADRRHSEIDQRKLGALTDEEGRDDHQGRAAV
jgi:hypothetical protein